jgi:branched-chain amino acid transport system permease protein
MEIKMSFLTELMPHIFNGLNLGLLYAIIALGFTLIVSQMELINMAHGSLFALGAYFALAILGQTDSFNNAPHPGLFMYIGALLLAALFVGVLGMGLEIPMRRTYGKKPLYGLLLTFGASYVIEELIRVVYGTTEAYIKIPTVLSGSIMLGSISFSQYRFFASAMAIILIIALWFLIEKTKLGAIIKAGAYDSEMVLALGINLKTLRMIVFGLGAFLAAVAGVVIAPIWGIRPHMGQNAVLPAFLIVALGGVGSFWGTITAAMIIGMGTGLTGAYASDWSMVSMFITLLLVLTFRSRGLAGKRSRLDE